MQVHNIKTSNFVNIKCRLVYKSDPAKKFREKNCDTLFFVSWTFKSIVAENEKGKKNMDIRQT